MSVFLTGNDELFARWAAERVPYIGEYGFGACKTIAIATGTAPEDSVLAVVVLHEFLPHTRTCMVSVAAASPLWATRGNIRAILRVPFEQYKVRKLWSVIASTNARSLKLNRGLGFKVEGTLRHHFAPRVHAIVAGMMDYEWASRWGPNAQPRSTRHTMTGDGHGQSRGAKAA